MSKSFCLLGLLGWSGLSVLAADAELVAEIKLVKDQIVLGEPLGGTLWLSNTTAQTLTRMRSGLFGIGAELEVSQDGQRFQRYAPDGWVIGAGYVEADPIRYRQPAAPLVIGPAGLLSRQFSVLFSSQNLWQTGKPLAFYLFPQAGVYHLRIGGAGVTSTVSQVTVRQPAGADAMAWDQLQQIALYPSFLERPTHYGVAADMIAYFQKTAADDQAKGIRPFGSDYLESLRYIDQLATVVDQHPDSVYAHRLAFALGQHYSGPRGDLANDERLRRAKKYFRLATQLQQIPALREPAWWEWVQIETDDQARADLCRQALQSFPDGALRNSFLDFYGLAASRLADGNVRFVAEVEEPTIAECRQKNLSDKECTELMLQRQTAWLRQNFNPLGDGIPPALTILGANPLTIECGSPYADAGATATDNKDGDITARIVVENNVDTPKVGTYQVIYRVSDAAGNTATATRTVKVVYKFAGFLAPLGGADTTGGTYAEPVRVFKLGSTIPLKFQISCGGAAVKDGVHTLQLVKFNNETTAAEPIDATPADAATTGNQFKLAGEEWHYNLDTKTANLSAGTWQLKATLADGSIRTVWIALK